MGDAGAGRGVAGAAEAVERDGCVLLPNAVPADACDALARAVDARVAEVLAALAARGLDPSAHGCPEFRFVEAASRCPGRLDVRFPHGSSIEAAVAGTAVEAVCSAVLGAGGGGAAIAAGGGGGAAGHPAAVQAARESGGDLLYAGAVVSFPGSEDQGWHVDGDHLDGTLQLPPHALTVFVAPAAVAESAGLPEFFLGSHRLEEAAKLTSGEEAVDAPVAFPLERGTALIFDYRLVHRGTGNSAPEPRTLPYFVFGRKGWVDKANFDDAESLLPP